MSTMIGGAWRRRISVLMIAVMFCISGPLGVANAALVTTDQVIDEQATTAERARVLDFLARQDVREQFETLGVNPDEALARTANLTDAEIQQIAGRLDELPAGEGAVSAIVIGVVVIFLVLLLTDLLGLTEVFPFVKSQR